MPDINSITDSLGISGFNLGAGQMGNIVIFSILVLTIFTIILAGIIFWVYRRQYKHRVPIIGKVGNKIIIKETDWAKEVPFGRAGDKLFLLSKSKKYIPKPLIQTGANEWLHFEREDGELINVGYADLNETMKELGFDFGQADMRMQRLGIEKNLQFRHQKDGFWDKYRDMIVNFGFYVLLTVLLIVIFYQLSKVVGSLNGALQTMNEIIKEQNRADNPLPLDGSTAGVIGSMILLSFRIKRLEKQ